MRAQQVKIILWVCALVGVWQLGRSYAATNALFLFAAAGVVPGTDIVLGPNQVLELLSGLLALAVLLIFGTNLRRTLWFWFGRRVATPPADAASPAVVAKHGKKGKAGKPKPVVIIEVPKQPSVLAVTWRRVRAGIAIVSAMLAAKARVHFPRLAAATTRARASTGKVIRVAWHDAQRIIRAAWQPVPPLLRRVGQALQVAVIRLAITTGVYAVRFCRWLEPYLREFDRWLGVQYHQGLATASKNESVKMTRRLIRETSKVITAWRSEIRAALSRLVEK